MKNIKTSLLFGSVAVVVTIILYFITLGNIFAEMIHFTTLLGVVIAEIITTIWACSSGGNPRRVASTMFSALMIPVAIVLSVVYIVSFPYGYGTYVAWYIAFLLVINLTSVAISLFDTKKEAENDLLQSAKENMLNMRKIVKCIIAIPGAAEYEKDLRAIEEKLHYSNDAVIAAQDKKIMNMLLQLQDNISNSEFDSSKLISEIKVCVDSRNIMA